MQTIKRFVIWLFSRTGLLCIWIAAVLIALVAVLYWHFNRETIFSNLGEWLWLVAALALIWLPLLLLLLDPPDNYSKGPKPWLPIVSLLVLVGLAAFAFLDGYLRWHFISSEYALQVRVIFFSILAVTLLARIWNAANFARFEAERRKERSEQAKSAYLNDLRKHYPQSETKDLPQDKAESGDATALSALIVTAAVFVIGTLAFLAGNGTTMSLRSSFGFFLCFGVIGVFVVVVLLDAFAELDVVRGLSRSFEGLARIGRPFAAVYGAIDSFLVRIGSAVVGMGHHGLPMRYLILIGTMGALSLMGLFLPAPLGLIPALVGFTLSIAVSRLWNWVEDDRALAALTKYKPTAPYQSDFREDFLDETLLGFAFVFLLAPIAMMQANDGAVFGAHLFGNADTRGFDDWIGFFGIELAKAIPMVDWAEVYGVQTTRDMITINGPASRHSVFLARVMVDLVLIAALLQAVGVLTRNRQQKQLYRAGHIDRLDPFVERTEFSRAIRAARAGDGNFDLTRLKAADLVDFRTYNEGQLKTLHGSTSETTRRTFIEQIARQRGIFLGSAIDLTIDIAESGGNEVDLINAFSRAIKEHDNNLHRMEADDLFRILSAIRAKTGMRDFKERAVDQLEKFATPSEVIEVLSGLAEGEKADRFLYARRYMNLALDRARSRI